MRLPKPTMRRSGKRMMTANVKIHVDIDAITNSLAYFMCYGESLDAVTKTKAYLLTVGNLTNLGIDWFPEGRDVDEAMDTARAKAEELFPELK